MTNASAASYLDALDERYALLHTAKEDAFWSAKMGLCADRRQAQRELEARDLALQQFLQASDQLSRLRELRAENDEQRLRIEGWLRTFGAHTIDSSRGSALAEELAADEGRLQVARGEMKLGFEDPNGSFVPASSIALSHLVQNDPDEARRRAAFAGLRAIESHVLDHGYLRIVAKRNELGQTLGAEDYYDWKAKRIEGMSKHDLFAVLDELEERTRPAARAYVEQARREHGEHALQPWNFGQLTSGEVTRDLDPYFSFRSAVDRWGRSFAGLGIRYAGAELVLDLLDRPGKYENGFMHGPVVAWRRGGQRIPARVQFTANALPDAVGAGQQALRARSALRQRRHAEPLLRPRVRAHLHRVRRNPKHVLGQPAGGRRLATALCTGPKWRGHAAVPARAQHRCAAAQSCLDHAFDACRLLRGEGDLRVAFVSPNRRNCAPFATRNRTQTSLSGRREPSPDTLDLTLDLRRLQLHLSRLRARSSGGGTGA